MMCPRCGEPFEPRTPRSRLCSDECRQAEKREKFNDAPIEELGPPAVVERILRAPARRRKPVPLKAGKKEKPWPAVPAGAVPAQHPSWRDRPDGPLSGPDMYRGRRNRSGLPTSGAPRPQHG